MSADATIEKAKAVIEEMRELLAKLEAEKATKRNWPEWIEAGDCFAYNDGCVYIYGDDDAKCLTCIKEVEDGDKLGWSYSREGFQRDKSHFTYLGHARDILTIRTDAHEPTGAELVGKVCEFSDDDFVGYTTRKAECHGAGVRGYMTQLGVWWKFARLAK